MLRRIERGGRRGPEVKKEKEAIRETNTGSSVALWSHLDGRWIPVSVPE